MSEYVAVAAGEKRLREILGDILGEATLDVVVETLTGEGVTADYKPRLKAVLLTVPMPDTKTKRPEANVPPELAPDTGITVTNSDGTHPIDPNEIRHDLGLPDPAAVVEPEPTPTVSTQAPVPVVPRFGGHFLPRVYRDEDDLRDVGIYADEDPSPDYY